MTVRPAAILLCAALCAAGTARADDEQRPAEEQKVAPSAFEKAEPEPVMHWGEGDGRSYWIPLVDIVFYEALQNLFNRTVVGGTDYDTNWGTFRDNVRGRWVFDNDPFVINQAGHPYQGSLYHTFARSAGIGYWGSLGYALFGSLLWETAGETTPPSINDQFTTAFGGSFFGETLFRLSSLTLERGHAAPGFWRELAAAFISPATGFNRLAYGSRFDGVFRSRDPAVYTRWQLGANLNASVQSNVDLSTTTGGSPVPQGYDRGEVISDFTVAYGLPGKPEYRYDRPFDYFDFQFTAASSNALENVVARGLLAGSGYGAGSSYRGVWGLFGTYDYIAPQIFRISSTGLAAGNVGQWWLSRTTALQSEVLLGAGYASAGIVQGRDERDYHHGIAPQGMVALRLILNDRAALDLTGSDWYVTDRASEESGGSENIARGHAGLTVRVHGLHGVTLRYTFSQREADYVGERGTRQSVGAVSLAYTYLGHRWFGAVDWRPEAQDK
ncbi:MAG TPA: DUF3943 domain-containing protein [Candidatus Binatia bacterium]|nr:DUF3943 domain-containing protein [Candidatus Binatia bacterium]